MANSYVDNLDAQSLASTTLVNEPRQQAKKQRAQAKRNAPALLSIRVACEIASLLLLYTVKPNDNKPLDSKL